MNIQEVKEVYSTEFGSIARKFEVIHLKINSAMNAENQMANRPGVYLFWHPKHEVVVVGKHQTNSKKRALEHVRDNTRNEHVQMGDLKDDPELDLFLFNVIENRDKHWVLALEAFFEWNINPIIKAHRMG